LTQTNARLPSYHTLSYQYIINPACSLPQSLNKAVCCIERLMMMLLMMHAMREDCIAIQGRARQIWPSKQIQPLYFVVAVAEFCSLLLHIRSLARVRQHAGKTPFGCCRCDNWYLTLRANVYTRPVLPLCTISAHVSPVRTPLGSCVEPRKLLPLMRARPRDHIRPHCRRLS
jgi:hypothetical protein